MSKFILVITGVVFAEIQAKGFKFVQYTISSFFIIAAIYIFTTSTDTILSYGLTTLFADHWRIYNDYFHSSFPDNLLILQNGHRPIIPGLFFLMDIHFFRAKETSLLILGLILAITSSVILFAQIIKDNKLPLVTKSLFFYIITISFFWLANARILLHGNEAVPMYSVIFFYIIALVALYQSKIAQLKILQSTLWALLACMFSFFSVISFGAGMATMPSLLLIAFVLRVPLRMLLIFFLNLVVGTISYLVLLPSSSDIVGVVVTTKQKITGLVNLLYLIGSPLSVLFSKNFTHLSTAIWINTILCPSIGFLGLLFVIILSIKSLRSKKEPDRAQTLLLGCTIFSAIVAMLITVMRTTFFMNNPTQVFAPRYIIWMNLFWSSLLILLIYIFQKKHIFGRKTVYGFIIVGSMITFIKIQSVQQQRIEWSKRWYSNTQIAAMSLIAGIFDEKAVTTLKSSIEEFIKVSQYMKQHRLNMFADPITDIVDNKVLLEINKNKAIIGNIWVSRIFPDFKTNKKAAEFTGWIAQTASSINKPKYIIVKNKTNICGVGTTDFNLVSSKYANTDFRSQHLYFKGYIKEYRKENNYTFYVLNKKYSMVTQIGKPQS